MYKFVFFLYLKIEVSIRIRVYNMKQREEEITRMKQCSYESLRENDSNEENSTYRRAR